MEAIIERCCGLDVHKDVVVACLLMGPPEGRARKQIRTYGTTTAQLDNCGIGSANRGAHTLGWNRLVCIGFRYMPC